MNERKRQSITALAGAIAEGAGKEIEALHQRIDAQQKEIQKLQYQVHHRD